MAVLGGGGGQRNVLWQRGCGRRLRRRAAEAWLWQVVAVAEQDLMVSIYFSNLHRNVGGAACGGAMQSHNNMMSRSVNMGP